ncbi:RluA family pseudouridine synthase [Inmirania thermothiophila]|uniref:tRNA pseudouridine32 synthase/23S rRNA pseudouridine746 synthase n=1 Tax=Inmirania thermothiophila TaxID=1750597 RepID=A0A3N1Y058_9GAMM|nr:RluA family pseudouridine synthase [Inmirania thermothiophila]ROR32200.1 tRNA pseudouridine32 synthase/23S rRNA pseudouridine746 synthase [Inmirania thermothiophila]
MAPLRPEQRIVLKREVGRDDPREACTFLARHTGLSKSAVKEAMSKGAAWLRRARRDGLGPRRRLRRAKTELRVGDRLELFYDPAVLALEPPRARLFQDLGEYGVWYKPAGLLAQGTDYGDHCALLRQVEKATRRPVFLVHRLDREAAGLMLVAHSRRAAAGLSRLFQQQRIEKRYRALLHGDLAAAHGARGRIDLPLDGKPAVTDYEVLDHDAEHDRTLVDVLITTGRLHQIRRHFAALGHPVVGDSRYGAGAPAAPGMRLVAYGLAFRCPLSGREIRLALPEARIGLGAAPPAGDDAAARAAD